MSDTDEVDRLHGRLVEGALDEDGRARLQTLLADSETRRYFAVLMQVDGGLCELHRAPAVARPLPRLLRSRPATRRRAPLWLPALAASVLVAFGLAFWPAKPSAPVPEAPLALWLDGAARPSPSRATPEVAGPGRLRLPDGSRLELDAGCVVTLADDGGVDLAQGRLRAVVVPQALDRRLVVRTAQAEVRVLGTVFSVTVGAEGTEVGVERGLVEVAPVGRPTQAVAAGAAVLVTAQGAVRPAPAPTWSIDLAAGAARALWSGTPRSNGLEVAYDAVTSEEFAFPTWNLQSPDPGVLGIAAFDAQAELRWEVSLTRRTLVAINLQTWARDGVTWLGAVQRQEELEPGRHTLVWPLRSFQPMEGAAPAAMQGMPIRRLIVVVWDGEAAVTAHRFALGRSAAE